MYKKKKKNVQIIVDDGGSLSLFEVVLKTINITDSYNTEQIV